MTCKPGRKPEPPRQLSLVDDGATEWRGRKVSVRERKRNAERAKEWRSNPENVARFNKKRDEWMEANRAHVRKQRQDYYLRNKKAVRTKREYERRKAEGRVNFHADRLRLKYGITVADYDSMLAKQNGQCAICGATKSKSPHGRLIVDHCHVTNQIRGLLCDDCNVGIGRLKDSYAGVARAAEYLYQFEYNQSEKRRA